MSGRLARFALAIRIGAMLGVMAVAIALGRGGAAAEERGWARFTSAQDGFASDYPGTPTLRDQGVPGGMRIRSWEFADDSGVYAVSVTSNAQMSASDFMLALVGAARRDTSGKVVARQGKSITVAGRTASVATIQVDDTTPDTIIAFDGPGKRMYQLHAPGQADSPGVVRFRDSFRLLTK
jgi:hypothetical protein